MSARVDIQRDGLLKHSVGVGKFGQEYLKWVGAAGVSQIFCRCGQHWPRVWQDWSRVYVGVGDIGLKCLSEWVELVKISAKMSSIGQECLQEWVGLVKCLKWAGVGGIGQPFRGSGQV